MNQCEKSITSNPPNACEELVVPPPDVVAFFVSVSRKLMNWKVETLASFAGVSASTVERVERGEQVSVDSLDKIGIALGYEAGHMTQPRRRKSTAEASKDLSEKLGHLEVVDVERFSKEAQVRSAGNCQSILVHQPSVPEDMLGQISALVEWLDLASFILNDEFEMSDMNGRRRKFYSDVLHYVRTIEKQGYTVLFGVMDSPQPSFPDWKTAVLAISPKETDPGAIKRKQLFIDRRNVELRDIPF